MRYAAKLITALVVAAVVGASVGFVGRKLDEAYRARTHVITKNLGGSIIEHYDMFTAWRMRGDKVRVEGLCISACTMVLGLIPAPHVCASTFASFGFHSAYAKTSMGRVPVKDGSSIMWQTYPELVREALKKAGWKDPAEPQMDLIFIKGTDLIQPCKD
jgi:hypothetical protein